VNLAPSEGWLRGDNGRLPLVEAEVWQNYDVVLLSHRGRSRCLIVVGRILAVRSDAEVKIAI